MTVARIELPDFVNQGTVEHAYRRSKLFVHRRMHHMRDQGMRAARARDPKLLLALEYSAEILHGMAEAQYGRTGRDKSTQFSHTVEPTEVQLWKNAYEMCDKGADDEGLGPYGWIYAAAAEMAGLAVP